MEAVDDQSVASLMVGRGAGVTERRALVRRRTLGMKTLTIPSHSNPMETKTCTKCGKVAPRTEFYTRDAACKTCRIAAVKRRRRTDPAVQAYDRDRAKTADRRARSRAIVIRWRAENPEGYRAHTAVGNALRDGKIKRRPCEKCGATRVHAHHDDYSQPLVVSWLCASCHHRMHADHKAHP